MTQDGMRASFAVVAHTLTVVLLAVAILMVNNLSEQVADRGPGFTGVVYRFDGGAVEVAQKVGESLEDFVARYRRAITEYQEDR